MDIKKGIARMRYVYHNTMLKIYDAATRHDIIKVDSAVRLMTRHIIAVL